MTFPVDVSDPPFALPPDDVIIVELAGVPVGKGRPRFVRATGAAYTPSKTRRYENDLRLAAQEVMGKRPPICGPVTVRVEAHMPIPSSWSRKMRAAALQGMVHPTTRPDPDNLLKSLDAFNEIVFRDDRQVVEATVVKVYSDRPRLWVQVRELGA